MKSCVNCQSEISDFAEFCSMCGKRQTIKCKNCDADLKLEDLYCGNCGSSVKEKHYKNKNRHIIKVFLGIFISFFLVIFLINIIGSFDSTLGPTITNNQKTAIEIVKSSHVYDDRLETQDYINELISDIKPDIIEGWSSIRIEDDEYLVVFTYIEDENETKPMAYFFEVHLESEIVYVIVGDRDLEEKYRALEYLE